MYITHRHFGDLTAGPFRSRNDREYAMRKRQFYGGVIATNCRSLTNSPDRLFGRSPFGRRSWGRLAVCPVLAFATNPRGARRTARCHSKCSGDAIASGRGLVLRLYSFTEDRGSVHAGSHRSNARDFEPACRWI